jgi:hypothetical protein
MHRTRSLSLRNCRARGTFFGLLCPDQLLHKAAQLESSESETEEKSQLVSYLADGATYGGPDSI